MNKETKSPTFKTPPNSAFILWFLLGYIWINIDFFSSTYAKINVWEIKNIYYRIGLNIFLNSIIAIGFKDIYSLLKKTTAGEFDMNIEESDGFRIIFFKKCAKFYDKLSESLLETVHFLVKEKILIVALWLLLTANIIWALMSPHFFNIVISLQINLIVSHFVIFGVIYWAINSTYNLLQYCKYFDRNWSPAKLDKIGNKWKKEVSIANILDKIFDFLRQNSFSKVFGYVKKFDLFSACASFAITVISYLILLLEFPLKKVLGLFNTKYLFFLVEPTILLLKTIVRLINLLINFIFIQVANLYSIGMLLMSCFVGFLFFDLSHLILSDFESSMLVISLILSYYFIWISLWAMITYSIFYQLLDTFHPINMKIRLNKIDDLFPGFRSQSTTNSLWVGSISLNIVIIFLLIFINKDLLLSAYNKGNNFILTNKKELIYVGKNSSKIINEINSKIEKQKKAGE